MRNHTAHRDFENSTHCNFIRKTACIQISSDLPHTTRRAGAFFVLATTNNHIVYVMVKSKTVKLKLKQ